jgi:3-oxoadipate enol-lactonase
VKSEDEVVAKIRVNGVEIYYEVHGPEGADWLVLNNGIIMSAALSWPLQKPDLSRRYQLLLYDCRGQGQSEHPPGPYSMGLHADDLAALLDALGIENLHVGGISYGGEVAQAFALKYPQRTRSLILADTVSEIGPALCAIIKSWIDALESKDPIRFYHATLPWNFSAQFIQDNPALLEDAKKRYAQLDFPAVLRLCECFLEVDFTARLGKIQAQTCIMVGEHDHLKGLDYARILRQGIPQAELHVLEGAGHASAWEKPAEFNTIILGFLEKTRGNEQNQIPVKTSP